MTGYRYSWIVERDLDFVQIDGDRAELRDGTFCVYRNDGDGGEYLVGALPLLKWSRVDVMSQTTGERNGFRKVTDC